MYLESDIERLLREALEAWGFKVLKLKTPGHMGVMDRMILRPSYSPGPPAFVELKRQTGRLAKLQSAMATEWQNRGVTVYDPCWNHEQVRALAGRLIEAVMPEYLAAKANAA